MIITAYDPVDVCVEGLLHQASSCKYPGSQVQVLSFGTAHGIVCPRLCASVASTI